MAQTDDSLTLAAEGAMTVIDAARHLGISRSRLYELMDDGEIRYVHIGRRRLVPRASVQHYLASLIAAQHPSRPAA